MLLNVLFRHLRAVDSTLKMPLQYFIQKKKNQDCIYILYMVNIKSVGLEVLNTSKKKKVYELLLTKQAIQGEKQNKTQYWQQQTNSTVGQILLCIRTVHKLLSHSMHRGTGVIKQHSINEDNKIWQWKIVMNKDTFPLSMDWAHILSLSQITLQDGGLFCQVATCLSGQAGREAYLFETQ